MITYIGQTRHAGVYFSMEYTGADDLGVAKASVQFAKWSEVQRPMFDDFVNHKEHICKLQNRD